jgi:hypothetical protein
MMLPRQQAQVRLGRRHRHMGSRQIRIDRHVEARRSSFDVAQHQVLHCIEADCSPRDRIAHRSGDLIGAEHLHQP